jgi:hypothetical protein
LIVDSGRLTVGWQLHWKGFIELSSQRPSLQQGLHVAASIQHAIDVNSPIRYAIDYPIRLEMRLPIFGDPHSLHLL